MTLNVPKIKFYNGNEIPAFGLGTWKSQPGEVTQAVKDAIDIGYRHIDCAHVYGNEKEVGAAITAKISEGVIKREDLFITSKLWCNYHRTERVEVNLKMILSDLGIDDLDLYLIHWPFAYPDGPVNIPGNPDGTMKLEDTDYLDTWKGMEGVLAKGLTKNIGVSNFNSQQLDRLIKNCKVKPVVNQFECHPWLTQKPLTAFCKERGIVVEAYSPLGSPDRPYAKPNDPRLLDDKRLVVLSKKYNKSPAQILIRYQLDRGHVVFPKSAIKSELIENSQVFDFTLDTKDMEYLDAMNCNRRMVPMTECEASPYYPFHITF